MADHRPPGPTRSADQLISCYSDIPHVHVFRGYSRSKSNVVKNSTKFLQFFALPNFLGAGLPKVVPKLSCLPPIMSHGKVSEVTPTSPKVIGTRMLNYKLNFKSSPLKFFWEPLCLFRVCVNLNLLLCCYATFGVYTLLQHTHGFWLYMLITSLVTGRCC